MIRKRISVILIFTIAFGCVKAQVESFIANEAQHFLIGDQIDIDFILKITDDYQVDGIDLTTLDSVYSLQGELDTLGRMNYPLGDFNILDYGYWQTNKNEAFTVKEENWPVQKLNNKKIFQNKIKLSFWETGSFEIKDISYQVSKNDQKQLFHSGQSLKIIITAPGNLEEMSPDSIEIAPIKNILVEPSLLEDYLPYVYSLLSLALIGLLIFYLSRLKKEKVVEVVPDPIRPAHVIALEQLDYLENEKLWQNNKIKSYQSRLTHIIREYLENRYDIRALEMTTDEIVGQLKNKDFEMKWKDGLKRTLQIADLVKFAKAEPPLEINKQFMDEARAFISNTMEIESTINQNIEEELDV